MDTKKNPKTLMEAIRHFENPDVAREYVVKLRWPAGPFCVECGLTGDDIIFMTKAQRWKCRGCKNQFSIKQGTIMEDSALALDKWLCAIWMISNCRNGVSSYEVSRNLGITQKSAWFMLHRIRLAMEMGSIEKPLSGIIEADETFIGPKVRKANRKARAKIGKVNSWQGKTPIAGLAERGGDVRATVVPAVDVNTIFPFIQKNVEKGSKLFTDQGAVYRSRFIKKNYDHQTVNHILDEYVRGEVHTSTIDNFWTLIKRSLHGTYINVEPFHLFRYVEEHVFRFNRRKDSDGLRFESLVSRLFGKRLTYANLIGGAVKLQSA